MKKNLSIVIMAAGLGTRMKSEYPKVLHKIDFKPLIIHVLEKAIKLKPDSISIIIGHLGHMVKEEVSKWLKNENINININFVNQKLLKGSGRAIYESILAFKDFDNVLILSGDAPLTKTETLSKMIKNFYLEKADCLVLTCDVEDVKSYGRILRKDNGDLKAIVEKSELKGDENKIKEVNSGIYIFNTKKLIKALHLLKPKGPKKEYFLTDTIEYLISLNNKVKAFKINDEIQITGINSKQELEKAYKILLKENNENLMENGITIIDSSNTYISLNIKIGRDTIIYPGCFISGKTKIGKNCKIGPYSIIENCEIKDNIEIKPFSCLYNSYIDENASIGPFSHLRPLSKIGKNVKIGNFSEIKKSKIGNNSKIQHLSYIGDTFMGERVNIGAGTITCNYDGIRKNETLIEDNAFVGSNTNLVAPVKVGKNSLIGAGSTITEDVPKNALALARARQVNKERKR